MSDPPLLAGIKSPADLQSLPAERLPELAAELRQRILSVVSRNGGHLASNLGTVELTVALLRVFGTDRDALIWDTGHQAYSFKLLTGRNELFDSLRQDDGCGAFLSPRESRYDLFGAGHAGTAISAALGFAAARDRNQREGHVVAIAGDGALGSGVALEGLNSIIETTDNFILVLNDNRMSIAPNVGALSQYLNRTISGQRYLRVRRTVADALEAIPVFGRRLHKWFRRVLLAAKGLLTPGAVFEELGLSYIGPLDGHDIPELIRTLKAVRRFQRPVVVHVLTEKGHGYPRAVQAPETFHGMGRFDPESGEPDVTPASEQPRAKTFSSHLGDTLCSLMERDSAIVAITAGMCHGTGLTAVRNRFPERFFDVGIAEEHAVVFAAGLAAAGMKPVVAIYATFMQRAYDYVFHDVVLQNLPVMFCLDRAGVVEDGPTHHGIHDLSLWTGLHGLDVLQPADAPMMTAMLDAQIQAGRPTILRYPKANAEALSVNAIPNYEIGRAAVLRDGGDVAIWAVGREVEAALTVARNLEIAGINCTLVDVRSIRPLDARALRDHAGRMPVVTLENHCATTGFALCAKLVLASVPGARLLVRGWPDQAIPGGTEKGIREKYRMTPEALAEDISDFVREQGQ